MTFAERLARLVAEEHAKIEAIRTENWRANAPVRAAAAMLSEYLQNACHTAQPKREP